VNGKARNLLGGLILLGLVCAFFNRCIVGGEIFYLSDSRSLFHPHQLFFVKHLKGGTFPFWNPHSFCGVPFLADASGGLLYPFHLLTLAIPVFKAMTAAIIVEVFLAGFFVYLFLREIGRSFAGAIIGGISFALSGPVLILTNHITMTGSLCWMGGLFFFFERSIRRESAKWALGGAFCLAMSILAGGMHATYMAVFAFLLYFLFRFGGVLLNEGAGALGKVLLPLGIIVIFSAGATAIQTVPALELAGLSKGTGGAAGSVGFGDLAPSALINALFPKVWGMPGEDTVWNWRASFVCYFGLVSLLLASVSFFKSEAKERWFFILLAVLGLLISLGTNAPVSFILYRYLPGFRLFTSPSEFLVVFCFAGCISASFGFDSLTACKDATASNMRSLFYLILTLSIVAVVPVVVLFSSDFAKTPTWAEWLGALAGTENLDAPAVFDIISRGLIHGLTAVIIMCILSIIYLWGVMPRALYALLVIILLCADLFLAGRGFARTADESSFAKENEFLAKIPKEENYRISGTPGNDHVKYDLYSIGGYETFALERYSKFIELASKGNIGEATGIPASSIDKKNLDYLGVKYLVSDSPRAKEGMRLIEESTGSFLYENAGALPRAYFVAGVIPAGDERTAFDILKKREMDFSKQAVVEMRDTSFAEAAQGTADIEILEYTPNHILFQIEGLEHDSMCIVTETYYPGWRAYADRAEIPIYKANGAFRGVMVPAGTRVLEMRFSQNNFYRASGVSLFFLIAGIVVLLLPRHRRRSVPR